MGKNHHIKLLCYQQKGIGNMVKLNKYINSLERVIEKIEYRIEELEEKKTILEDRAGESDREMTNRELYLYDKYDKEIEELEAEKDDIENALDCIREYAD